MYLNLCVMTQYMILAYTSLYQNVFRKLNYNFYSDIVITINKITTDDAILYC